MELSTTYLGLELKNPLVAAASPLTKEVDSVRKLEDAGVAAVVMYSLFQEQIEHEDAERDHYQEHGTESFVEAQSYFPALDDYRRGPEEYLEHLAALKKAVNIPVIASLNGTTTGGWIDYARKVEQAGADALELNPYRVATDPDAAGAAVENQYVEILRAVKEAVKLPVAVKLAPYFSSLANFARRLDAAGADGLVLFNRFYQPDIDLEVREVVPEVTFSAPHEMRIPLRWIAVLDPLVKASLAATTGIYTAPDVLKLLMAGADVTQLCAVLLRNGPSAVGHILAGMKEWMTEHEYESVRQMQGSMNQRTCPDPAAFERGQYMKALNAFTPNI
jgi:dihydroorotate dehydrogenase (fumarate)